MAQTQYKIVGLMSGTSLDGLDIAHCVFSKKNNKWNYEITAAETIKYSQSWAHKLSTAHQLSGLELAALHGAYGSFLGNEAARFCKKYKVKPDYISSHGHTVFHQPAKGFTLQIGSGAYIAAVAKTSVICDFRSLDVANGGQGAPLVPIGDELLFSEYKYCLNLGGFANISFRNNKKRKAFDICPANIILNHFAKKAKQAYDKNGALARRGSVNLQLLQELNKLPYYKKNQSAKSLGREWVEEVVLPVIEKYKLSVHDILATCTEHIAYQIAKSVKLKHAKMLVTGGGAYNDYLIKRIKFYCSAELIIPSSAIIEFKEALVFAFLGLLRVEGEINALQSVTGARSNSISGCVYIHK